MVMHERSWTDGLDDRDLVEEPEDGLDSEEEEQDEPAELSIDERIERIDGLLGFAEPPQLEPETSTDDEEETDAAGR
jgi:hypothetical protein